MTAFAPGAGPPEKRMATRGRLIDAAVLSVAMSLNQEQVGKIARAS
jgi:hypothetical protein